MVTGNKTVMMMNAGVIQNGNNVKTGTTFFFFFFNILSLFK
jgi:hypothetical protein